MRHQVLYPQSELLTQKCWEVSYRIYSSKQVMLHTLSLAVQLNLSTGLNRVRVQVNKTCFVATKLLIAISSLDLSSHSAFLYNMCQSQKQVIGNVNLASTEWRLCLFFKTTSAKLRVSVLKISMLHSSKNRRRRRVMLQRFFRMLWGSVSKPTQMVQVTCSQLVLRRIQSLSL